MTYDLEILRQNAPEGATHFDPSMGVYLNLEQNRNDRDEMWHWDNPDLSLVEKWEKQLISLYPRIGAKVLTPKEEKTLREETIEEVRAAAPEGATHYSFDYKLYAKIVSDDEIYTLNTKASRPMWHKVHSPHHYKVINWKSELIKLSLEPSKPEGVIGYSRSGEQLIGAYIAPDRISPEEFQLQMGETVLTPTEENPSSDEIINACFKAFTSTEVPGYEKLSDVLGRAYDQASKGKGKERHAGGKPFHEQPMQVISDMFDSPVGMYFQAIKKIRESHRLPTTEAQVRELLGAINYIAGIIIFLEKEGKDV